MKHPHHDMTTDKALSLARDLKYGPLPKPADPTPSLKEAWELINDARHTCGHQWITADAALDCISWSMANPENQAEKGTAVKSRTSNHDNHHHAHSLRAWVWWWSSSTKEGITCQP